MKRGIGLLAVILVTTSATLVNADSASFRYGVNGYTGVHDTQIGKRDADPDLQNACEGRYGDAWLFNAMNGDIFRSVVIRFDDIFTSTGETGKIPLGSRIDSATLTLQVVQSVNYEGCIWQIGQLIDHVQDFADSPTDDAYSMKDGIVTWNERIKGSAVWSTPGLAEGADFINPVEEILYWEDQMKVHKIDITAVAQSWADGQANEGLIIKQKTPYAWDNYIKLGMSENATEANRPMLTVNFSGGSTTKIPGDANNDGLVDVGDLGILAGNYGTPTGATWEMGDFNKDGAVDVGDLGILAGNYGTGPKAAAVPEPMSLALLSLGGLVLRRRK